VTCGLSIPVLVLVLDALDGREGYQWVVSSSS
jgi:hypothetical protein